MKLYYHSILSNSRAQDNKLIKNACEKIVMNIFFKAQNEMKKEAEKIVVTQYQGEELEDISRALFAGRVENHSYELEILKEKLRKEAVKKYSGVQSLNLTRLAKENRINITRIREELISLGEKWFIFNFINRKKIPTELLTRVVKEVGFVQREEGLIFQYQIPVPVLNFLIFPNQYAPVDMEIIKKLKSKYSIKLYLLVLDHKKRGLLQLEKNEILECFSLPESYSKNRKIFLNKFLIPTLKELEEVARLKLTYDFKQEYSFQQLELRIQRNRNNFSKKLLEKIEFAKRNQYIKRNWDGKVHDFLLDFYNDKGEAMTSLLLQNAYQKINSPIRTTLHNYLLFISKQLEVNIQEREIEKSLEIEQLFPEDKVCSSWDKYLSFPEIDRKIYRNLARKLFEEKLGTDVYSEDFFNASFKSLVKEILEF